MLSPTVYTKRISVKSEAPIGADPDVAAEVVRELLKRAGEQEWNLLSLELYRTVVGGEFRVPRSMLIQPAMVPDEGLVQRWAEQVCKEMVKAVEQGVQRWRDGNGRNLVEGEVQR